MNKVSSASKLFNNIENRTKSSIVSNVLGNDIYVDRSRIEYNEVPIDDITPRPINNYTQSRIDNLAKSIRSTDNRLINPIVIVKPTDLPETSEVLKKYKNDNVDISNIKYIIVAGERRYRACLLNRKLFNDDPNNLNIKNPYDTITANILTKDEAQHEEIYYKDSNDQARQLTPIEGIKHIETILNQIETDEDKQKCLIEMYGIENVPNDPSKAAKQFRQDKYILYYLSSELGIEGWQESTVRTYAKVVKECDPTIIDAVLAGEFPANQARQIYSFNKEAQIQLLDEYKLDKEKYLIDLKELSKKSKTTVNIQKGKPIIDKELKNINKKINTSLKVITSQEEELGKTDRERLKEIYEEIDILNGKIAYFLK